MTSKGCIPAPGERGMSEQPTDEQREADKVAQIREYLVLSQDLAARLSPERPCRIPEILPLLSDSSSLDHPRRARPA